MDELYDKIVGLAEQVELIVNHGGISGDIEYLQFAVKRLARLYRLAGENVYWDKVEYSCDLLNECLDYVWYTLF